MSVLEIPLFMLVFTLAIWLGVRWLNRGARNEANAIFLAASDPAVDFENIKFRVAVFKINYGGRAASKLIERILEQRVINAIISTSESSE